MTLATQAVERLTLRLRELVGETHVFTTTASYLADETETRGLLRDHARRPQSSDAVHAHGGLARNRGVEDVIKARTGRVHVVDAPAPGVGWP